MSTVLKNIFHLTLGLILISLLFLACSKEDIKTYPSSIVIGQEEGMIITKIESSTLNGLSGIDIDNDGESDFSLDLWADWKTGHPSGYSIYFNSDVGRQVYYHIDTIYYRWDSTKQSPRIEKGLLMLPFDSGSVYNRNLDYFFGESSLLFTASTDALWDNYVVPYSRPFYLGIAKQVNSTLRLGWIKLTVVISPSNVTVHEVAIQK